jgi:Domain of unknown function (DUF4375)
MNDNRIFVSSESIASDDPHDIVWSNISFLNELQEEYITYSELSPDAMQSYYIDYYLAQVNNGGFAQFVYNSGWNFVLIGHVRDGLKAIGATRHLALFEESAALVDQVGPEGMGKFFQSEPFGENHERDLLNAFNDQFYALEEEESLTDLNARWLRAHPELVVCTEEELEAEIVRRAEAVPDREERIAQARASEPRYYKLVRALCAQTGQELDDLTAGSPETYNGKSYLAWHFLTDQGHHYMIDTGELALMFNDDSRSPIATFSIPPDLGD